MASRKKLVGNNLCFIQLDPMRNLRWDEGVGKGANTRISKGYQGYLKSGRPASGDSFRDSNSATFQKKHDLLGQ